MKAVLGNDMPVMTEKNKTNYEIKKRMNKESRKNIIGAYQARIEKANNSLK